jgi:hypothetical protein
MRSSLIRRRKRLGTHMARPHSIKQEVLEQVPAASIQVALADQTLLQVDLADLVDQAALAQSSTLRIFSMLSVVRQVERDEDDEGVGRFKKRFWLERILRCRPISRLWTLQRGCRRILSSRLWYNARLVQALD